MPSYHLIGLIGCATLALLVSSRAELPRYMVEKSTFPNTSSSLNNAGEVRAILTFGSRSQVLYGSNGIQIGALNSAPAGVTNMFEAGSGNLTETGKTPIGLVQWGGVQAAGIGDFRTGQIQVIPGTPNNADSLLEPRISSSNDYVVVMAGPAVGQLQPYRYHSSTGWQALGQVTPAGDSRPLAVNASGSVVGWAEDADEEERPFFYTNEGGLKAITNGTERLFGQATAINNNGLIAGTANGRAFVFNGSTMEFTYLTPESDQDAVDINNAGAILGVFNGGDFFGIPGGGAWIATKDDGFQLLNNLIEQDNTDPIWRIFDAVDINDEGWILGSAYNFSEKTSYQVLLRPVPEPSAPGLLLLAAGLAGLKRQRKIS